MTASSPMMLAEVTVEVATVLALGAALAPLAQRLRQPRVIAEIVAGIALGPSVLGLLPWHLPTRFFPLAQRGDLSAIAQVGILLFMFLVGWEMNPGQARRQRKAVLAISMSAMALPFGIGMALAIWLYRYHRVAGGHHVGKIAFVLFFGTAISITAFPVLARIIKEHRLAQSPIGVIAIASAAVGDVLAWCMLACVSAIAVSADPTQLARIAGYSALYIACLVLLVRPALIAIVTRMSRGDGASQSVLAVIVAGVFIAGYVTQLIGLDAIFGAFSFGLIMPRGSAELLARIREPVEHAALLLLPVFFVTTGLSVDLTHIGGSYWQLVAIIAVACLGKILGSVGAARLSAMSWRDSAVIGLLMNTRGLTELIILNIGMSMHILDTQVFSMMVVMALVTTGMAGPLIPRRVSTDPEPQFIADDSLVRPGHIKGNESPNRAN
jgi:Kef-type K+ transport system membrane component KefB